MASATMQFSELTLNDVGNASTVFCLKQHGAQCQLIRYLELSASIARLLLVYEQLVNISLSIFHYTAV